MRQSSFGSDRPYPDLLTVFNRIPSSDVTRDPERKSRSRRPMKQNHWRAKFADRAVRSRRLYVGVVSLFVSQSQRSLMVHGLAGSNPASSAAMTRADNLILPQAERASDRLPCGVTDRDQRWHQNDYLHRRWPRAPYCSWYPCKSELPHLALAEFRTGAHHGLSSYLQTTAPAGTTNEVTP